MVRPGRGVLILASGAEPAVPTGREILVRLLPLEIAPPELERLKALLSREELGRGDRLLDPARRDRFFAGRGMLRELLGRCLGEEPRRVRISEGKTGKPYLPDHRGPDALRFNVSHSGEFLVVALALGHEVGIDIEEMRQDLSYEPMARRFFSPREREELFGLPQEEQLQAFYRCWTCKEAYLKATGSGFLHPSSAFDVTLLPGQPPALLAHRGSHRDVERWEIADVDVPAPYCAAVAYQSER